MTWERRLSYIKSRADKNGIECTITADDLEKLWELQDGKCLYTGVTMVTEHGNRGNPAGVSADRIRHDQGYVPGNVVLCSYRANTIKHNMTLEEFEEWMPLWHSRLKEFINEQQDF